MPGLLDLPAEIRTQIYRLLFYSAKCKIPIYLGSKDNAMCNRSFNAAIFRLNKMIHQDAIEEIYSKNDFFMRPFTGENWLPSLSRLACHYIQHLRIDLDGSVQENGVFQDIWECAFERLDRLTEIRLLFHHTSSHLIETIVAVSEVVVNRIKLPEHSPPTVKLDLTVGTPTPGERWGEDLPACTRDSPIWTNEDFYLGCYNEFRVFDMDSPKRRAMPDIVIEALTEPFELLAIQRYRNSDWSFNFSRPIPLREASKGRCYQATFEALKADGTLSLRGAGKDGRTNGADFHGGMARDTDSDIDPPNGADGGNEQLIDLGEELRHSEI